MACLSVVIRRYIPGGSCFQIPKKKKDSSLSCTCHDLLFRYLSILNGDSKPCLVLQSVVYININSWSRGIIMMNESTDLCADIARRFHFMHLLPRKELIYNVHILLNTTSLRHKSHERCFF